VHSVLSREEIERAIRTLPDAGMVRLRKIAAAFCRGTLLDPLDLLQEAFARALGGTRHCPVDVDVVRFLAETMHSVASDEAKKRVRHRELQTVPLFAEDGLAHDPPDPEANAEEVLSGEQETRRIRQTVIDLFADDLVAQVMVEGMMEDMEGEELRGVTGLTKIAFASKRRLIRRRIDEAFPQGWTL
jgi:DNA-directed RNA polymerase specialized sigma24 family protein